MQTVGIVAQMIAIMDVVIVVVDFATEVFVISTGGIELLADGLLEGHDTTVGINVDGCWVVTLFCIERLVGTNVISESTANTGDAVGAFTTTTLSELRDGFCVGIEIGIVVEAIGNREVGFEVDLLGHVVGNVNLVPLSTTIEGWNVVISDEGKDDDVNNALGCSVGSWVITKWDAGTFVAAASTIGEGNVLLLSIIAIVGRYVSPNISWDVAVGWEVVACTGWLEIVKVEGSDVDKSAAV
jgi:hypothetical protein